MNSKKEESFSFLDDRKEKFKARVRELIGNRSIRAAAKDWGLSFSTLNNYLTRNTEPALYNVQLIADKEQVSIDWLSGKDELTTAIEPTTDDKSLDMWLFIIKSLNKKKADELLQALLNKGVDGVLSAIRDNEESHNKRKADPIADFLAGVPETVAENPDPDAPWVDEETRAQLKETLIEKGFNREKISSLIMLFSLPAQEAREILAEYASGKRASLPQGVDFKGQEKKAKSG